MEKLRNVQLLLVCFFTFCHCNPDLQVTNFRKSLSSAVLAKITYLGDYATIVDFSVTFENVATGADIASRTDGQANYDVQIALSDTTVCSNLTPSRFTGVFNKEREIEKLHAGLLGGGGPLTVEGQTAVNVQTNCSSITSMCVVVSEHPTAGYNETQLDNNCLCHDVSAIVDCSGDGVDLYLQQFLVPRGVLYTGRPNPLHLSLRVQLHGAATVTPDPDRALQVYTVRLYLSRDTKLDPEGIDTEIHHVPSAFTELGRWVVKTETLILGGPDLRLPPAHTWPDDQPYCGPVYLIAHIDPGPDHGQIPEVDEWNNVKVLAVTVICENDVWGLSEAALSLGPGPSPYPLYPDTEYTLSLTGRLFRLHPDAKHDALAGAELKLYLHNSAFIDSSDTTPLDLTRSTTVQYANTARSPLAHISPGESVSLQGTTLTIAADQLTAAMTSGQYSHLVVRVVVPYHLRDEVDEVSFNDQVALAVALQAPTTTIDVAVEGLDIYLASDGSAPARVVADGNTTVNITLGATVSLGSVSASDVTATLLLSADDTLDAGDVDTGLAVTVDSDGSIQLTPGLLTTPSDSRLCGHVYLILNVASPGMLDGNPGNNWRADDVVVVCNVTDILVLQSVRLLDSGQRFFGENVEVEVTCLAEDCSSITSYTIFVYLDRNDVKNGDEQFDDNEDTVTVSSFTSRTHTSSIQVNLLAHIEFPILPFLGVLIKVGSLNEGDEDSDPITDNNYRVLPYELHLTFPELYNTIEIGSVSFVTATRTATLQVQTEGADDFDSSEPVPHFDLVAYVSESTTYDRNQVSWLKYTILPCESGKNTDIGIIVNIEVPDDISNKYCDRDVYFGMILATKQSTYAAVLDGEPLYHTTSTSTRFTQCDTYTYTDSINVKIIDDEVPDPVHGNSEYAETWRITVYIHNDRTVALAADTAVTLDVYLSSGPPLYTHVVQLEVTTGGVVSGGIGPATGVLADLHVQLPNNIMTASECDVLLAGTPALLVNPQVGGITATEGKRPIQVLCDIKLSASISSFDSVEPFIWQGSYIYDVSVNLKIENEWPYNISSDFDIVVGFALAPSATDMLEWSMTTSNRTSTSSYLGPGDVLWVKVQGKATVSAAACSDVHSNYAVLVQLIPHQEDIDRGVKDTWTRLQLSNQNFFKCTAGVMDLSVSSFILQAADNDAAASNFEPGEQRRYKVEVRLGGSYSAGAPNYDYEFIIGQDQTTYTSDDIIPRDPADPYPSPEGDNRLEQEVVPGDSHQLIGDKFEVSDIRLCGVISVTVHVFDVSNDGMSGRNIPEPGAAQTLMERATQDSADVDPVLSNNLKTIKLTLNCRDDVFAMTLPSLPVMRTTYSSSDVRVTFSASVVDSFTDNLGNCYTMVGAADGAHNFDFKITDGPGGNEVRVKRLKYTTEDEKVVSGEIRCGQVVQVTDVEAFLLDPTVTCAQLETAKLAVVRGPALPAGFHDYLTANDWSDISTCTDLFDLRIDTVTITAMTLTNTDFTIDVEYPDNIGVPTITFDLAISMEATWSGQHDNHTTLTSDFSRTNKQYAWTVAATSIPSGLEWKCRILYLLVNARVSGNAIDLNLENNMAATAFQAPCDTSEFPGDGDRYGSDVLAIEGTCSGPQVAFPGQSVPISCNNITVINKNAMGLSDVDLELKLFWQRGADFEHLEAYDATPSLWYADKTEMTQLNQDYSINDERELTQVIGTLKSSEEACDLGVDNLFFGVTIRSVSINSNIVTKECALRNNFLAIPMRCAEQGEVDLRLGRSARGVPEVYVDGAELVVGGHRPLHLEVDVLLSGNGMGWSSQPPDAAPMFDVHLYLEKNGVRQRVQYDLNRHMVNQETHTSRTLRLGGPVYLDDEVFVEWSGPGHSLIVMIDPTDQVDEVDEGNNEFVITGITVENTQPCSRFDLVAEDVDVSLLYPSLPDPPDHVLHAGLVGGLDNSVNLFTLTYRVRWNSAQCSNLAVEVTFAVSPTDSVTHDNQTLTVPISHDVADHTTQVQFNRTFEPFDEPFWQGFCGASAWLGAHLMTPDLNTSNNWVWRRIHFYCHYVTGISPCVFSLHRTSNDDRLSPGPETNLWFELGVCNKADNLDFTRSAETVSASIVEFYVLYKRCDGNLVREVTNTKDTPTKFIAGMERRSQDIRTLRASLFPVIRIDLTISDNDCDDVCYICLVLKRGDGLIPEFYDSETDNEVCVNVREGNVQIVCHQDLAIWEVELSPEFAGIYQDIDVLVNFTVNVTVQGQVFVPSDLPHFSLEVCLSDRLDDPEPFSLNNGHKIVLAGPEDIQFDRESENALTRELPGDTVLLLTGRARVHLEARFCSHVEPRYLCVKWVASPELLFGIDDQNPNNDFICLDARNYINCTTELVDLQPVLFEPRGEGTIIALPDNPNPFDLLVKVIVGPSGNVVLPDFSVNLYLSQDPYLHLNGTDHLIPYDGFGYGQARDEMRRTLTPGENTLNLGGIPLVLQAADVLATNTCGHAYIIAVVDPANAVEETITENNTLSTPVWISCYTDTLVLREASVRMLGKAVTGRSATLVLDLLVQNINRDVTIPMSSPELTVDESASRRGRGYFVKVEVKVPQMESGQEKNMLFYSEKVTYPRNFYRRIRPLESVRLTNITVESTLTLNQSTCLTADAFRVSLVKGEDIFDNVLEDNFIDVPFYADDKMCIGDDAPTVQLRLERFALPTLLDEMAPAPVAIDVSLLRDPALEVPGVSVLLLLSRSPLRMPPPMSAMTSQAVMSSYTHVWRHLLLAPADPPVAARRLEVQRVTGLQVAAWPLPDRTLCGPVWVAVVVDPDDAVSEPDEGWALHVQQRQTAIRCPGDIFGVADVELLTTDHQLTETLNMPFTLRATVTCMSDDCHSGSGTENVKFVLTSRPTLESRAAYPLASVNAASSSFTVRPALGSSYQYTGHSRRFDIQGLALQLPMTGCGPDGTVWLTLHVSVGSDLSHKHDLVAENNYFDFIYPCVTGFDADLQVSDFKALPPAPQVAPGSVLGFSFLLGITGGRVPPTDAAPPAVSFRMQFLVSSDPEPSSDDIDLHYEMTQSVGETLRGGLEPGQPQIISEPTGLLLPMDLCGKFHILLNVSDRNMMDEKIKFNNMASYELTINCDKDLVAVQDVVMSGTPYLCQGVSAILVLDVTLTGMDDVPPCPAPGATFRPFVLLSSDDRWDQDGDAEMPLAENSRATWEGLSAGVGRGQTLTVKGVTTKAFSIGASCEVVHYVIVGVLLACPEEPRVEMTLHNNYRAIPVAIRCSGEVDLRPQVSAVVFSANMYTIDYNLHVRTTSNIDPVVTLFWLSADDHLDPDHDHLVQSTSHLTWVAPSDTTVADQVQVVSAALNASLQGNAYLLAQVDPWDEVAECDETNNVVSFLLDDNAANSQHRPNLFTDQDLFGLTLVSADMPTRVSLGESFQANLSLTVSCLRTDGMCPGQASSTTRAAPTHYHLLLKALDENLEEVGPMNPEVLDLYWTSDVLMDADPLTDMSPDDGFSHNFGSSKEVQLAIKDYLKFEDQATCVRVRYLAVQLEKGNSDEVLAAAAEWWNVDNDVRYVPFDVICEEYPANLTIENFRVLQGGSEVTSISLDEAGSISMSVELLSSTGHWPRPKSELDSVVDIRLYLRDPGDPDSAMDTNLELPEAVAQLLLYPSISGRLSQTLTVDLLNLRPSWVLPLCGKRAELLLEVDGRKHSPMEAFVFRQASVQLDVINCPAEAMDMRLVAVMGRPYVLSGEDVLLQLNYQVVLIGQQQVPRAYYEKKNFILGATLAQGPVATVDDLELSLANVTESETVQEFRPDGGTPAGHSTVISKTINCSVPIPTQQSYCGRAWFLTSNVIWESEGVTELYNDNNNLTEVIYIGCRRDVLYLDHVVITSIPETLWPVLSVPLTLNVTVANAGPAQVDPERLFRLQICFSRDELLDDEDDCFFLQKDGEVYENKGFFPMEGQQTISGLTVEVSLQNQSHCAEAAESNPMFFVVMVPEKSEYSTYTGNDMVNIPIDRAALRCPPGVVDLIVKLFWPGTKESRTDVVVAGQTSSYTLTVWASKIHGSASRIPASTGADLSMAISMSLALEGAPLSEASPVVVTLSDRQLGKLQFGVPEVTANPFVIELDGPGLRVDVDQKPEYRKFCGKCNLIVSISDEKNVPSIDPDLSDNTWVEPITLDCPNDLFAVHTFMLSPRFPETTLHSGLPLLVDLSVVVWNRLSEDVPADASGRPHLQLSLYLTADPEMHPRDLRRTDTTAAPVEILDPEQLSANLTGLLAAGRALSVISPVWVLFPKSACQLRYLALLVTQGAQVEGKDDVQENNVRFLDLKPSPTVRMLHCSKVYVDLIVESFDVSPGISPSSIAFVVNVTVQLEEYDPIGDPNTALFDIQFYVSLDQYLDDGDFSLDFQPGPTILGRLRTKVSTSQTLRLDSQNGNEVMMSPDLPPRLCGSVFLLVVVDDAQVLDERSKGNNVGHAPWSMNCNRDIFQLKSVDVKSSTIYPGYPSPVHLKHLTVINAMSSAINADGTNSLFNIKLSLAMEGQTVEHDITPLEWIYSAEEEGVQTSALGVGESAVFSRLSGDVSSSASICVEGSSRKAWQLKTGPVRLIVNVLAGPHHHQLNQLTEGVLQNNRMEVIGWIDCKSDYQDLVISTVPSFDLISPPLYFGATANPFRFGVDVIIRGQLERSDHAGWLSRPEADPNPVFMYEMYLSAGGMSVRIPYDVSRKKAVINQGVFQDTTLDLTDTAGFNLTAHDFLFLCSFRNNITFSVKVDTGDQLREAHEENNLATRTGVSLSTSDCSGRGLDINALGFRLTNLQQDAFKKDTNVSYELDILVTITGSRVSPDENQFGTEHTDWAFILSTDDVYDDAQGVKMPDYKTDSIPLEPGQENPLRTPMSPDSSLRLHLTGDQFFIPLSRETQIYCWKYVYVGVLLEPADALEEVNEDNNVAFTRTYFDCGDNVNECELGIHQCSEDATCEDTDYNSDGNGYECTCRGGFIQNGRECENIDECARNPNLCPDLNQTCHDTHGDYNCDCPKGYRTVEKTLECENKNECMEGNPCQQFSNCTDVVGSYKCTCWAGYTLDGDICKATEIESRLKGLRDLYMRKTNPAKLKSGSPFEALPARTQHIVTRLAFLAPYKRPSSGGRHKSTLPQFEPPAAAGENPAPTSTSTSTSTPATVTSGTVESQPEPSTSAVGATGGATGGAEGSSEEEEESSESSESEKEVEPTEEVTTVTQKTSDTTTTATQPKTTSTRTTRSSKKVQGSFKPPRSLSERSNSAGSNAQQDMTAKKGTCESMATTTAPISVVAKEGSGDAPQPAAVVAAEAKKTGKGKRKRSGSLEKAKQDAQSGVGGSEKEKTAASQPDPGTSMASNKKFVKGKKGKKKTVPEPEADKKNESASAENKAAKDNAAKDDANASDVALLSQDQEDEAIDLSQPKNAPPRSPSPALNAEDIVSSVDGSPKGRKKRAAERFQGILSSDSECEVVEGVDAKEKEQDRSPFVPNKMPPIQLTPKSEKKTLKGRTTKKEREVLEASRRAEIEERRTAAIETIAVNLLAAEKTDVAPPPPPPAPEETDDDALWAKMLLNRIKQIQNEELKEDFKQHVSIIALQATRGKWQLSPVKPVGYNPYSMYGGVPSPVLNVRPPVMRQLPMPSASSVQEFNSWPNQPQQQTRKPNVSQQGTQPTSTSTPMQTSMPLASTSTYQASASNHHGMTQSDWENQFPSFHNNMMGM